MIIEKKVPIPKQTKPFKYPWADLKIGDSFFTDTRSSMYSMLKNYNKRLPKSKQIEITTRREGIGQRVWRTK
jgi:hypothetical protein